MNRPAILAVLKGLWIYGLVLWAYVVFAVYITPETQTLPLSYYVWIPTDLAGVLAFAVSFASFILWEFLRH